MPQQREECTNHPRGAVATDTEDKTSDGEDIVMPLLVCPEGCDDKEDVPCESLIDPPSAEPTPELGPPSEKPTKEPTSEPDSSTLSEPSAPTGEGSMGHLYPKEISLYQKGSDTPRFFTLEERTKEDPWGDIWNIRIWGQDKSLEAGEDPPTPTKSPFQIPTNLEEVGKDAVGAEIMREDMDKLWSTQDLLVQDKR